MSKQKITQPWDYFPIIPIYAFTSLKKARKFIKKKTGCEYTFLGKDGQCTMYKHVSGANFCLILLNCKDKSTKDKYSVLAHECVHYAQNHAEYTGAPLDDETEAYIVEAAMLACIDQIGAKYFKGK